MVKYFIIPVAALTVFVACNQKEMDFNKESVTEPEIETVQMTFRAATEDSPTKTTLNEETGAVAWAVGDAVKFVYELDETPGNTTSDALAAEDIDGEGVATFTASVPAAFEMTEEEYKAGGGSSLHLYAVSPASIDIDYRKATSFFSFYLTVPTVQDGTFENASIAVAKWDKTNPSGTLEFKNLCGLLKFTIADDAVRKVILHSDDYIAGKMDIGFTGGPAVKNVSEGEKAITVNVPGAGTYYIAVLPTNAEKGIGINNIYVELLDESDNLIGDKGSANPLVIARKQIRSIGTLATGFSDRLYIKAGGTGSGSSWTDAGGVTELLQVMQSTTAVTKNIYMAAGDYKIPDKDAKAPAGSSIKMYGGYPSDASGYSLSGRNIESNITKIYNDSGRTFYTRNGNWLFEGITFNSTGYSSANANAFGCALVLIGGNITVNKCKIVDSNHAGTGNPTGGAVRVNTTATFTDCEFTGNSSTGTNGYGGAIYVTASGNLTLKNCVFKDNSAAYNGGALYIAKSGTVTATGCTFGESGHPNSSTKQGGAIFVGGTLDATDCAFAYNNATTQGGAIEVSNGSLTTVGCTFTGNTSTSHGSSIETANASVVKLSQCVFLDNISSNAACDLYIGGTTSLYANACYFGQSSADTQIASAAPHRILTGGSTNVGFNNCVICGPFGKSNALTQLSGNTVIVNSTIYSSVGSSSATNKASMASIYNGSTNENGCRIINSIVLNNTSEGAGRLSFSVASSRYMQVYNSVYSLTSVSGTFTPTSCVSGKYNASTLDENAFPDNSAWSQKYLGTAATLPDGSAVKAYVWDGVCDGFTKTTLVDIKTLISGTTGVGSGFLTWLESEDLKVNGKEALSVDIRGVARNTSAMWPGSYEQASGVASAPAFTVK